MVRIPTEVWERIQKQTSSHMGLYEEVMKGWEELIDEGLVAEEQFVRHYVRLVEVNG